MDDALSFGHCQLHQQLWRELPGFMRVQGSKGLLNLGPVFSYQGINLKADIHGETPVEETNPAQGRSAICKQKPIIWPTAFSPQNSLRPAEKKAAAISSILANLYQAWRAYVVEPKNSLSRLSTGVATFT